MQPNNIAHIYLTVSDFDACLPFYEKLLEFFEMHCLVKTDALYYCAGGRTGLGIRRAAARHEDIDRVHDFVTGLGARIIHPPREDDWAPGRAPQAWVGRLRDRGARARAAHGDMGHGAPPQAGAGMAHSRKESQPRRAKPNK
jgi:catechol 2,3-dioxygenase-like lactoylglutathione lyase family enzyme